MTNTSRAYLALAAICLIWGTTYTAIKFAVRDFPPYLLVGIRQTAAGLLMLGLALLVAKKALPDSRYIRRQMLTGIATITGGNGFITWGMQYVPSGVAAIIGSLTPVVVVLISLAWQSGQERINARVLAGVLLGFGGLGLVFSEGWSDLLKPEYRWGIAGCFGSCLTWSLGTVMAKRWNSPDVSPLLNAGLQITAGGLGGFVLSLFWDKNWDIHHSTQGWLSIVYLIIFGSALAFTLYMYALKHLSASVSSLYTYINPVVAILLGWALLGESLSTLELVGMAVTIAGVWLVNAGAQAAPQKAD
jgi:drug/metabolite transporter (DMT)-like permease